jgi:hypothetical protein
VSLTVVFRETALRNLARIRSDDKDLFLRTRGPSPCWLISRIQRVRSRGALRGSTACTRATFGSCTKSMTKRRRCTSSTSGSCPESDRTLKQSAWPDSYLRRVGTGAAAAPQGHPWPRSRVGRRPVAELLGRPAARGPGAGPGGGRWLPGRHSVYLASQSALATWSVRKGCVQCSGDLEYQVPKTLDGYT